MTDGDGQPQPSAECLGCERIAIAVVTLRDGRVVCDECESWRLETEAREVLGWPLEKRRNYLSQMEAKGKIRVVALKQEILAQFNQLKGHPK
jgi:hypothetical protein